MLAGILEWILEPYGLQGILKPPMTKECIKTSFCKQYILLSHRGCPENSGLARLVLYDMVLRSWDALHVSKDWICSCPFSQNTALLIFYYQNDTTRQAKWGNEVVI